MADLKISQLTALDSGDVASTDVLAVVDVSATQTKKLRLQTWLHMSMVLHLPALQPWMAWMMLQ